MTPMSWIRHARNSSSPSLTPIVRASTWLAVAPSNARRVDVTGYQVLGLSPDDLAAQKKFRDEEHVPYPLLCDPSHEVLESYGAWGEKKLYGKTVEGVIRSTVALDAQGTVTHAWYNVKATGHVAKLRRDLGLE